LGFFSFWAIWALLERWGMTDPEVSEALTTAADATPDVVQYFAQFIPDITHNRERCRLRLLEIARLPSLQRPDFLAAGFAKLGVDHTDGEVVDALLPLLQPASAMDPTAVIIGQFRSDPRVRAFALDLAPHRNAPLGVIARAYPSDKDFRHILLQRANPLPTAMRRALVNYAIRRHGEYPELRRVLVHYDDEREPLVRTAAEIGYCEALILDGVDVGATVSKLEIELHAIGPEMDTLRQSALAGLIALNHPPSSATEERGSEKQTLKVEVWGSLHRNNVLLEQIAEKWSPLTEAYGTTIFDRFAKWDQFPKSEAWAALASHVDRSEAVRRAFLQYCKDTAVRLIAEQIQLVIVHHRSGTVDCLQDQ
jgi:hypothetical protein